MNSPEKIRLAIIVPSVELGAYWLPVVYELTKLFPDTIFYTGKIWPGFNPNAPGASAIQLVGKVSFIEANKIATGYSQGFIYASPSIIPYLLRFKPSLIFASAFSIWTLLVLMVKPIGGWKVVIIYDGSSPNTDFRDSKFRSFFRRIMGRFTDAFIANSQAGKKYILDILGVPESKILVRPYLVPDANSLLKNLEKHQISETEFKRPVFLFIGRIISRKGLKELLAACDLLCQQGYQNYTILVLGKGDQRQELEEFVKERNLSDYIKWIGFVDYGLLGNYFQEADVFVFPTLEDVWGMVLPEAMVFGKPVLCSKWAAACELVVEGENGFIFDPYNAQELAQKMAYFIDHPEAIAPMGEKSQQLVAEHNPQAVAKFFGDIAVTLVQDDHLTFKSGA